MSAHTGPITQRRAGESTHQPRDALISQDTLLGFVTRHPRFPRQGSRTSGLMSSRRSLAPGTRTPQGAGFPELPPALPAAHLVQQRQLDLLMGNECALLGLPGGRLLGGCRLLGFTAGRRLRGLGQLCGRVPFPLVLFNPIFFFRLSCQQQILSHSRHPGTAVSCGPPGGDVLSARPRVWGTELGGSCAFLCKRVRQRAHPLSAKGLPASAATMPRTRGAPCTFLLLGLGWGGGPRTC